MPLNIKLDSPLSKSFFPLINVLGNFLLLCKYQFGSCTQGSPFITTYLSQCLSRNYFSLVEALSMLHRKRMRRYLVDLTLFQYRVKDQIAPPDMSCYTFRYYFIKQVSVNISKKSFRISEIKADFNTRPRAMLAFGNFRIMT